MPSEKVAQPQKLSDLFNSLRRLSVKHSLQLICAQEDVIP
jgi:hypothetical protein